MASTEAGEALALTKDDVKFRVPAHRVAESFSSSRASIFALAHGDRERLMARVSE